MMLRIIIIKEISGVLNSFRFHILFIIAMLVFLLGGLLHVNTFKTRYEGYTAQNIQQTQELQENSSSLNKVATLTQYLARKPKAEDVISLNGEQDLPNQIYFNAFYLGGNRAGSGIRYHIFANTDHSNYKLNSYELFDWTFIAGVILSFFILVLTYDAFSGEKQAGTLKMQCAFPVSRLILFVSKYLAYLAIITSVFLLGMILNLVTIKLASGFQAEMPSAGHIVGILCTYLVYFSFFILLGLWFSSKAGQPATSLAYSLFAWLLLVFFLPSAMAMLGEKIYSIPSASEHRDQMQSAKRQVWDNAPQRAHSYGPPRAFGGKVYPYMDLRKEVIDEMDAVRNNYSVTGFNDMYKQARFGSDLGKISPYVVMRGIAERIAGNGLEDFSNNFNRVVNHRRMLHEFVEDKDKEDPESFHFVNSWHPETYSFSSVAFDEIPVIEDADPAIVSALKDSVLDLGILFFFNLIVLVGGWSGFLKYDVR